MVTVSRLSHDTSRSENIIIQVFFYQKVMDAHIIIEVTLNFHK